MRAKPITPEIISYIEQAFCKDQPTFRSIENDVIPAQAGIQNLPAVQLDPRLRGDDRTLNDVIPAQAGIQNLSAVQLDPRLRGDDRTLNDVIPAQAGIQDLSAFQMDPRLRGDDRTLNDVIPAQAGIQNLSAIQLDPRLRGDDRLSGNNKKPNRTEVQVSPIEGKFIQLILSIAKAKKVLEIGTMHGYSSAWILSALPQDGVLTTIEKSQEAYAQAVVNIGGDARVQLINQDATEILPDMVASSYDAMFIDGNKAAYPFYLDQAARLLRPGGVLLADDALLFAELWLNCNSSELSSMQKGIAEFNAELSKSRFFQGLVLPMLHGMMVAVRSNEPLSKK